MAVALLAESDGRRDRRLSLGDFEWTRADLSARIAFELRCSAAASGQRHLVFSKNGAYVCGRDLTDHRTTDNKTTRQRDTLKS